MVRSRAQRETSAGGVVYRVVDGTPLFLLIRDAYHNWGFPKGHVEVNEELESAALREVEEETGLHALTLRGPIDTIDWYFRFRGRLVHKICHYFLMESATATTSPQREEGITACNWLPLDDALSRISYENARGVLTRAAELVPPPTGHAAGVIG